MPIPTAKRTRSSHRTHATTNTTPRRSLPLNSAGFAPFGDVIAAREVEARGLSRTEANQRTATKWLDVTNVHDFYDECSSGEQAKVVINMFVCRPRELEERNGRMVFPVRILERHPFTAQMFVPIGVSPADENVRYLVIVAPTLPSPNDDSTNSITGYPDHHSGPVRKGPGLPDLDNIKAFIASGDQAVSYGPGTWHAPMCVLGERPIDFIVVQYANGVASEDCQELDVDIGQDIAVDVGDAEELRSKL